MQTVEIYAIAAGGILVALASFSLFPQLRPAFRRLSLLGSKYLTYPHLIHRHRLLGPCSRADILAQAVYVTANVLCFSFKASDFQKAGLRAGTLALVNVIPLFAGFDFGRLADILGLPLEKMRGVHVSAGVMSVVLMAIHVSTVLVQKVPFGLREGKNVFAVIVSRGWSVMLAVSLTCVTGSLFVGSGRRPLESLLPKVVVRNLPAYASVLGRSVCLFRLATFTLRFIASSAVRLRARRSLRFQLDPPIHRHLLPQWFAPLQGSPSEHHGQRKAGASLCRSPQTDKS